MQDIEDQTATTPDPKSWLYPFLSGLGVTSFEANLSGGGDSGSIDDITWFRGEEMVPNAEIEDPLSALTIDDGSPQRATFLDAFHIMVENDAANEGNYYDNEGGSVWSRYLLDPESRTLVMEESSFAENEPDYDDEEEEWDPFDEAPEEDEDDDLDVEP